MPAPVNIFSRVVPTPTGPESAYSIAAHLMRGLGPMAVHAEAHRLLDEFVARYHETYCVTADSDAEAIDYSPPQRGATADTDVRRRIQVARDRLRDRDLEKRIEWLEQRLAELEMRHSAEPFLDTANNMFVKYPHLIEHKAKRRRVMKAFRQG